MSVGGLFALLALIALAVSVALLKPQIPGRIVFAGFAAGLFLLSMFEAHYSRLSVFSFILMLVGFLHELAADRRRGCIGAKSGYFNREISFSKCLTPDLTRAICRASQKTLAGIRCLQL